MKKGLKKRGISPVIATILLVAIVMVIALIIFLWFRGMVGDYGEKFGKNIELVCEEVQLEASYLGDTLYITNDGNVPVYNMNVMISRDRSHETSELSDLATTWPIKGLAQGMAFAESLNINANKITLIPILIGTSNEGGKKIYVCDERYGYELIVS